MRIVHIYSMREDAERIRKVGPEHAAYWRTLDLPGYLGGPFDDRSGGVISFETNSITRAERLIADDPFVVEDLLESSSIKRWLADAGDQAEGDSPSSSPTIATSGE